MKNYNEAKILNHSQNLGRFRLIGIMFLFSITILSLTSCDDDDKEEDLRPESLELIVANDFEALYGQSVKLDASQTYDKLEAPIEFHWEAVSFPGDHFLEEYLQDVKQSAASFHPYDVGEFTFRVTASTQYENKTALLRISVDAEVVELAGPINDTKETWEPTTPPGMVDYRITGGISFNRSEIDVAPGVIIEMTQNTFINVYQGSYFSAVGTEEEPIVIRGSEALRGYWQSIRFESKTTKNRMEFVHISDGGNRRNNDRGMVTMGNDGMLHMERCILSNADRAALELGIIIGNPGQHLTHIANDYKNNQRPVFARPDAFHFLDAESDYTGNDIDAIDANGNFGRTPDEDVRWQALNVPYLAERIVVELKLTIEAGVHLKMAQNSYLKALNGQLHIEGTAEYPVLIEGEHASGATWQGIEFTTMGNSIRHLVIKNAGSATMGGGRPKANIVITGGLNLDFVHFEDGDGYGYYKTISANTVAGENITSTNLSGNLTNTWLLLTR